MPRHLDVDRISVVLVQRIESEFQVATNPSMDGTRGAPISWKKLTKCPTRIRTCQLAPRFIRDDSS